MKTASLLAWARNDKKYIAGGTPGYCHGFDSMALVAHAYRYGDSTWYCLVSRRYLVNNREILEAVSSESFKFSMKRLGVEIALDEHGLILDPDRFSIEDIVFDNGRYMLRTLLNVATQEETIAEIPVNWWEHLKKTIYRNTWFPRWIKRRFPVEVDWLVAVHKFPELNVPESLLGREFVHLKVVDPWELQDKLKGEHE